MSNPIAEAAVAVKLAGFWKSSPMLWFVQAEAQFALAGVVQDATRFLHIVTSIDQSVIRHVADLVMAPPAANKYEAIKQRLISRFEPTAQSKLENLFGSCNLENLRPTHLLAKMQQLSSGLDVDGDVLKILFLQRLPANIRAVLSIKDGSLSELAEMGDKMTDPTDVVPQPVPATGTKTVLECLEDQITALTAEIRRLKAQPDRERSSPGSGNSNNESICWYHRKFTSQAERCRSPCQFRQTKQQDSRPLETSEVDVTGHSRRLQIFDRTSNIRFLIDTGSDVSIIPVSRHEKMHGPSPFQLHAANGTKIRTYGSRFVTTDLGLRRRFSWNFLQADVTSAIIGADFLAHFGLLVDLGSKRLIDGGTRLHTIGGLMKPAIYGVTTVALNHPYRTLLSEFREITTPPTMRMEIRHDVTHHIQTTGPPVACKPRRMPPDKLRAAKQEFESMMELGICRPSKSCWASPLHCVPKKNGEWRFVGDYRSLNRVTVPDRYPVPHIHDLLNNFLGKRIFTTLDMVRAYYYVPVEECDVPKTAVITPFGLFEFTRMQFGLCNASQTFQRFMHRLFSDLDFVVVFVDDICIASTTEEEHQRHVRIVFERLKQNGLVLNLNKCKFAQTNVDFLGYEISESGIKPQADRVKAVEDYKQPVTVKELRRFLALLNGYKRFMPKAASLQKPLQDLIPGNRKNDTRKLQWNSDALSAFENCKRSLASAALLQYPDSSKPMCLMVDASDSAAGAVLQQYVGNDWQPLGFYSQKFSPAQRKYSVFGRELTAMKLAVQYFRHLIEGRTFIIYTDHRPLTYALDSNSNHLPHEDRYLEFISSFTRDIRHISGKDNYVADALSRVEAITTPSSVDFDQLANDQETDIELQRILKENNCSLKLELRTSYGGKQLYCDVSNNQRVRPFVPKQHRLQVLQGIHGLSHPGIRATRKLLSERFVWPAMNRDVTRFVQSCNDCQASKIHRHTSAAFKEFELPKSRFRHVHIDLVGPLPPSSGNRYLLTMVDRYSRWPEAVPLSDMLAETVAKAFVNTWVARFGVPETISTDQGRQFESQLFMELTRLLGALRVRTTAYHPQANGLVERLHRTLKAAIMCVDSKHWCDKLPLILLGLRTAIREDINCSVAEMTYGQPLRIPGEFIDQMVKDISHSDYLILLQQTMQQLSPIKNQHHSSHRVFIPKDLQTCKSVFVRVDTVKRSLQRPYEGPFEVLERFDKFMDLNINGKKQRIAIDRIKPAYVCDKDLDSVPTRDDKTRVTPSGHRVRFLA